MESDTLIILNVKELLKESFAEVLRRTPSLLQPTWEMQQGELALSKGLGLDIIGVVIFMM